MWLSYWVPVRGSVPRHYKTSRQQVHVLTRLGAIRGAGPGASSMSLHRNRRNDGLCGSSLELCRLALDVVNTRMMASRLASL